MHGYVIKLFKHHNFQGVPVYRYQDNFYTTAAGQTGRLVKGSLATVFPTACAVILELFLSIAIKRLVLVISFTQLTWIQQNRDHNLDITISIHPKEIESRDCKG